MRERLSEARGCGPAAADGDLLTVNGGNGALPARQGLFEVELDDGFEVVFFADEERVWFL